MPVVGHHAGVARQLDMAAGHQRIGERHAEPAGEVVVAGARRAQRGIARADGELAARRAPSSRRHLHDALHHLRHRRRGQPVIAVPALLLDGEQPRRGQARQMAAGGLRRDAGDARQLGRRQRAAVHQRVQHAGAGRVAGERGDLGERGVAGHGLILRLVRAPV